MEKDINRIPALKAVDHMAAIPRRLILVIKWLAFLAMIATGLIWLAYSFSWAYQFLHANFPDSPKWINRRIPAGIAHLSFGLWAAGVLVLAFANQKLARSGKRLTKNFSGNLLEYFDLEAARVFKKTRANRHLPFEKLLFYHILNSGDLEFALSRLEVSKIELKKKILAAMKERSKSFSRDVGDGMEAANAAARERIFAKAARIALGEGADRITIYALFLALSDHDADFQKAMDAVGLLKEDVEAAVLWQIRRNDYQNFRRRFWERDNLRLNLAQSPAAFMIGGHTAALDYYSRDLARDNPQKPGGAVLHLEEIERMEAALAKKTESGVLLAGDPGSGRNRVVYNFANRVLAESGPKILRHARILELNLPKLISECLERPMLAGAIEKIFDEAARAGNVVLVISEIDNYLGNHFNSEKLTNLDISDILAKHLKQANFRMIGITTFEGYHRCVQTAGDAIASLAKIELAPVSSGDATRVLREECLRRENECGLFFSMAALKEVARLADVFLPERAFPKKAINLLDDFIADFGQRKLKRKIVAAADIAKFFSRKYEVPAGIAEGAEKETLINLEQKIHEGLINQKEAVAEIANAMRRARVEIKQKKRTIGNFLFLGPTGVGKTETAKQLARVYFGSAAKMIRLNMAEYQTLDAIEKLIGNGQIPGYLTAAARENPFSILLIDEIEKADKRVLDIFLSIFDEGQIVDGAGRPVDFRNIITVATSNAGAEAIRQTVAAGQILAEQKDKIIGDLLANGIFKPEFLNRFDAVVMYRPLDQEEMARVAGLLLEEIKEGLRHKRIEFLITDELRREIARVGFHPEFGGRALRRAVQEKVENPIAAAMLGGGLKASDRFEIDIADWQVALKNIIIN